MKKVFILLFSLYLFTGCETIDQIREFFTDPDVSPIEETLKRSLPLAFAGQVAQRTVTGAPPDFVEIISPCNSFPCTSVVRFNVGESGFPWFAVPSSTTVTVAGLWTSPDQGLLSLLYTIRAVGSLKLIEVRTFPLQRSLQGDLIIASSRIDINPGSGPLVSVEVTDEEYNVEFDRFTNLATLEELIEVAQEVWMVSINDFATDDFSDDQYTLTGAGQFVTVAEEDVVALQVAALNLVVSSSCTTNPLDGDILLNMGGAMGETAQVGQAQLEFRGNCNGTVKVNIATGSYTGAIGKNIPFVIND